MSPTFICLSSIIRFVAPSDASANLMRYSCMYHCVSSVRCAEIATSGRALSGATLRPIVRRPYALRGWRG
jgi:hypothetical protein